MSSTELAANMVERYGPVMGGRDLQAALGYRTPPAFARAARLGAVGVPLFELPGRRGRFALTSEVVAMLERARNAV